MKVKADYVTNSSSASFILYIESDTINLEQFIIKWNSYIDDYISENKFRLDHKVKKYKENHEELLKKKKELEEKIENGTITKREQMSFDFLYKNVEDTVPDDNKIIKTQLGMMSYENLIGTTYKVEHITSMYNDFRDIPEWMVYLILKYNINPEDLNQIYGFKGIRLKISGDDF